MQYEILKEMNPRMKLAIADGSLYVLKEIGLKDTEMYQKLIRLDCKNIVRFYDTVAQDGRFYAVEEFSADDLFDYLFTATYDFEQDFTYEFEDTDEFQAFVDSNADQLDNYKEEYPAVMRWVEGGMVC